MFYNQEKHDFNIFPTKSISSYNLGLKLDGSDSRYGYNFSWALLNENS